MVVLQLDMAAVDDAKFFNSMIVAFFTSGIPYPMLSLGLAARLPDFRKASMIFILGYSLKPCQRQAVNPARLGAAKEVPLLVPMVLLGNCTVVPTPFEATSGFICPSEEGPRLVNPAATPVAGGNAAGHAGRRPGGLPYHRLCGPFPAKHPDGAGA